MNNLSKEKKQQLGLVIIVTIVILIGIWFGLVNAQQKNRAGFENQAKEMETKASNADKTVKQAEAINQRLENNRQELLAKEATLPDAKDAYSWLIRLMNQYTSSRPLANFATAAPTTPHDVGLLPKFPYKAVTFQNVKLTAFWDDFGKFLADFENEWPYLRVQNLTITPGATGEEKLDFQFDIVTLALTNKAPTISK